MNIEQLTSMQTEIEKAATDYAAKNKRETSSYYDTEQDLEHAFAAGMGSKIQLYEIALDNLLSAIPSQNNDADWWSDDLRKAINEAKELIGT